MPNDQVSVPAGSNHVAIKSVKPPTTFDLSRMVTIESNFQLDKAITLKSPPDAACLVSVPSHKAVDIILQMPMSKDGTAVLPFFAKTKPCAAYLHYNGAEVLSGTQTHKLVMKKGYSNKFAVSAEVKASASAGILGCDVSMEVSTGFSYEETMSTEKEESWETTVAAGKYVNYQPTLLYVYRLDKLPIFEGSEWKKLIRDANPRLKFYDGKGEFEKHLYFFVPVYKNRPFTILYSDDLVDDVPLDTLTDHLVNSRFSTLEF